MLYNKFKFFLPLQSLHMKWLKNKYMCHYSLILIEEQKKTLSINRKKSNTKFEFEQFVLKYDDEYSSRLARCTVF